MKRSPEKQCTPLSCVLQPIAGSTKPIMTRDSHLHLSQILTNFSENQQKKKQFNAGFPLLLLITEFVH